MTVLSVSIYKFNIIPIKVPTGFFWKLDKYILKFVWRNKFVRIVKKILKREKFQDAGGPAISDLKLFYKTSTNKTFWYWSMNEQIYKWYRLCSPEGDPGTMEI